MSPSRSEQSAVDMSFAEAPFYEVIAGRRVELLPMGAFPTQIASTSQLDWKDVPTWRLFPLTSGPEIATYRRIQPGPWFLTWPSKW